MGISLVYLEIYVLSIAIKKEKVNKLKFYCQ